MWEQVEALEHHADFPAHRADTFCLAGEGDAVDLNVAFLEILQMVDATNHRRLA
ncbi:hypothetical protein D3C75_1299220 [compost metagenome]